MQAERTIRLRRAEEGDALDIARLLDMSNGGVDVRLWKEEAGFDGDPYAYGAELVRNPRAPVYFKNVLIAEVDGKVAAMLVVIRINDPYPEIDEAEIPAYSRPSHRLLSQVPGAVYLRNMAVFPDFRGLNLATRLIDQVTGTATKAGIARTAAIIWSSNAIMQGMYEKRGFRRAAEESASAASPIYPEGTTLWLYVKDTAPGEGAAAGE
ncbi:MAG: GNAT family N-acetyltransferase [Hyphomicrobiaceae bacterium]|nr:GNAT family N-acetyltransferase [Hyphomicrobiaceae bacterium]